MKALYVRVSSEEQAKKGYSIEDQIAQCRQKAMTDEIIEYIDDGYSGEFLDRPAMMKLREDVKEGLIEEVICYDPDRLSRKLMNQLLVSEEIEKRARLIFVNHDYQKTPEGMLFYQMRGAIAEFEKAKINERMSAGRKRKALKGKVVRDPNMFGYILNKETYQFEIIEKEAEIVRLIFDLFTKPNNTVNGINGIAHYLNEKKIPTKRGGIWHRQVVRQLLFNEAYVGRFYHNRWDTEGMLGNKFKPKDERIPLKERPREEWIEVPCPAIVDEEVFNHAQRLLKESRRRWAKKGTNQYLLSGLLRCGECGNTMTGRRPKSWGKYIFEYTDIKNTAGTKNRGCGNRRKMEDLDKEVWEFVKNGLFNFEEIAAASESQDNRSNYEELEINRLEEEIKTAQLGRKRLLNLFSEGLDISDDEMRQSLKELKDKEEDLKNLLAEALYNKKENESSEYSKQLFQYANTYYLEHGGEDKMTFENKQVLIRQVIREIIIYKDTVRIFTF